ncbi:MAG TPA: restriction endonuclease subunit S, partial [Anaerolineales bacterium]|nr:restriction endonuclease subunit S [Anaerolineales bacterium]
MVSSKQVPLSEAFWFQEGPGVRNWQFTTSGVKLLNVGNITKDGNIDLDKTDKHISLDEAEGKYSHFLIDEGDLVIASSGISFDEDSMLRTRGAFIEKKHLPLCLNTSTIRFKAIEDVSDLNFFKFWLDSFEFRDQVSRLVTGSAQQNFGPSHLKAINISLPPLTEQKRVASLLARADRLRQLRRTAHDLSDSVLQSVFLEMFGEYLKPSNPFTLMEELVKITGGGTPSRDVPEYFEGNIPWLTSKDMRGDYIYDTQEHITEKAIKESATNLVPV